MTRSLPLLPDEAADSRGFGGLVGNVGTGEGGGLPLVAMDVQTRIVGLVAQTVVVQTFVNSYAEAIEATYTFPLPDRAAVTHFAMHVADKLVKGVLHERAEARQAYARAIAAGRRAAITEEERAGVFTLRVGNLQPGEVAVIRLEMVSLLPVDDGEATWRFPLVVAPRYTPGRPLDGASVGSGTAVDTDLVRDASRVSPPMLRVDPTASSVLEGSPQPVALSIGVDVRSLGLPVSDLRTSLHTVVVDASDDGQMQSLAVRPGERCNRDFILRFRCCDAVHRESLCIVPDVDDPGTSTFMLTVAPPVATPEQQKPRDVVFLLDTSGSMQGWKLVAARRALTSMVDTLTAADRFRVYRFASDVDTHGDGLNADLVTADAAGRAAATAFLGGVRAHGGTEMEAALQLGLDLLAGGYQDRERILVIVTDGQVTNEAALLHSLDSRIKGTRVFAIGIDDAVNSGLLTRLATTSGGLCELVESEARLDDVLERLHRRLSTPTLAELTLDFAGFEFDTDSQVPARLPPLFAGLPLVVTGRGRATGPVQATLGGVTLDGARRTAIIDGIITPDTAGVRATWARGRLRDLEDFYDRGRGDPNGLRASLTALSLRESVLCRFTSFLAVDERDMPVPKSPPRKVVQPVEPPASHGVSGGGGARLGELLVREDLVSPGQLQQAQQAQQHKGGKLGHHLVDLGFVAAPDLLGFLSRKYGVPAIALHEFSLDNDILRLVPRELSERHTLVPVIRSGDALVIAIDDPSNIFAIDDIAFITGYRIEVMVALADDIQACIAKSWHDLANPMVLEFRTDATDDFDEGVDSREGVDEDDEGALLVPTDTPTTLATVSTLVNQYIVDALQKGATAMVIELSPDGATCSIQHRIAGQWVPAMHPPARLYEEILHRLRVMAGMGPREIHGHIAFRHAQQAAEVEVVMLTDGAAFIALV
jgi:Ca-activated chloride channel family protein